MVRYCLRQERSFCDCCCLDWYYCIPWLSELALLLQHLLSHSNLSLDQGYLPAICHLVPQEASPLQWSFPWTIVIWPAYIVLRGTIAAHQQLKLIFSASKKSQHSTLHRLKPLHSLLQNLRNHKQSKYCCHDCLHHKKNDLIHSIWSNILFVYFIYIKRTTYINLWWQHAYRDDEHCQQQTAVVTIQLSVEGQQMHCKLSVLSGPWSSHALPAICLQVSHRTLCSCNKYSDFAVFHKVKCTLQSWSSGFVWHHTVSSSDSISLYILTGHDAHSKIIFMPPYKTIQLVSTTSSMFW